VYHCNDDYHSQKQSEQFVLHEFISLLTLLTVFWQNKTTPQKFVGLEIKLKFTLLFKQ
jgi:hypothetical protein